MQGHPCLGKDFPVAMPDHNARPLVGPRARAPFHCFCSRKCHFLQAIQWHVGNGCKLKMHFQFRILGVAINICLWRASKVWAIFFLSHPKKEINASLPSRKGFKQAGAVPQPALATAPTGPAEPQALHRMQPCDPQDWGPADQRPWGLPP